MNDMLRETFRHNAWATRQVIALCRTLKPEHLRSTTEGTYGSVLEILNHILYSEAGYLPRIRVTRPAWTPDEEAVVEDLDTLASRVDEVATLWDDYITDPLDARQLLSLDDGAYEAHASIPLVQALHHGNIHREQICAILTSIGVDPPDLQAWAWGEATGRARELRPAGA